MRRYKNLFKGENPNPDAEDHREVKMAQNQGLWASVYRKSQLVKAI